MRLSHPFISLISYLILVGSLTATLGIAGIYLYLNPRLPSVEALLDARMQIPLRIYSEDGYLIGEFGEKFRTPIDYEEIPQHMVNAVLSAEDDRFLKHSGIDIAGLLRAASELLSTGSIQSGGSTITMQVARNFFLSKEKSFVRKFNEILLSLKIERLLSKQEILELYLNKIYLGKRAYGIQAAAAIYYGKDVKELTLAQTAMIAGLPKAPSSNNPVNNPERALSRRNWILGRMNQLGFIDQGQWQSAIKESLSASNFGPRLQVDAQYAAEMARAFTIRKFGPNAYNDGLKVTTTISSAHQLAATQATQQGLDEYTIRHGYRGPELAVGNSSIDEQRRRLRSLDIVGEHIPALISSITSTSADPLTSVTQNDAGYELTLELNPNESVILPWTKSIRRYETEDRRSGRITNPEELLRPGDIIRIKVDENGVPSLSQLPTASASLVSLDPYNGAIKAIMGGYDFRMSKFNRATQAYRQPGSNFKPFIYAAAFNKGYTAASVINDAPIVFNDAKLETDWRPENASGKFYGPTTLRRALYLSRNLVSVRLLREVGIADAIEYLERFNFSAGKLPRDLSLALGSYVLTPMEVATLYAVIANGGYLITPHIVTSIETQDGQLLYQRDPLVACDNCSIDLAASAEREQPLNDEQEANSLTDVTPIEADNSIQQPSANNSSETINPLLQPAPRVMDERIAFILDNILLDTIKRGTATRARSLERSDLAGKTGTTNGPTDAWFSGYHPNLVTTTWLGFDDNQKLGRREFGGSAALPIWMSYMQSLLPTLPTGKRVQPEGLLAMKVDRITGRAPTFSTKETLFELFREEYAPRFEEPSATGSNNQTDRPQTLGEELF